MVHRPINSSFQPDNTSTRASSTVLINKPCMPLIILFIHFFVIMIFLLVFVWADSDDTSEKYLGGLNMGSKLFNWHPVFMTWATSCLVEGALAYRAMRFYSHRGICDCLPLNLHQFHHHRGALYIYIYVGKKIVHGFWNLMAVVLFSAGLASAFRYKEKNHIASLYSTHSWLGIFTVVLIFLQFVVGFGTYALPGITLLTKQRVYPLHSALGLASTVTAASAVLSGIDHENTILGCAYSV